MIKLLIFSSLLINATISQCTLGCLICTPLNTCALCDFSASFSLKAAACVLFTPPVNCILSDQNGVCLQCKTGFLIDTALKCSPIPTTNIITGCVQYKGLVCSTCNSTLFLSNSTCQKVTTQITNCLIYDSNQRCQQCSQGFLDAFERTSCQPIPNFANCFSYSNLSCNNCAAGFRINFNSYLLQLFGSSPDRASYAQWTQFPTANQIQPFNTCLVISNQNCLASNEFGHCLSCLPGFYLKGTTCVVNPIGGIQNCLNYSTFTTCLTCVNGFRLDQSTNCVPVDIIPFCSMTDPTQTQTICLVCSSGYYLIGPNMCVARTINNISNCSVLNSNSEICQTCSVGFVLTSDSLACFQQIQNCALYSNSNSANLIQLCSGCINGFFLSSDNLSCIQGTIQNCLIYQTNANFCEVCINRNYLSNGSCLPHQVIPNCNQYSQTTLNLCNSCQFNSFQFKQLNACAPVTPIANCAVYQAKTICQTCIDGFFLDSNTCTAISISENCLQKNGNFCIKCLINFILQDGICRDSLDIFINNCSVNNINGLLNYSQMVCNQCNENSIPMNYFDSFYCVDNNYLTWLLQNNNQSINSNCLQYKPINNVFLCVRCVTGFFVSNGACVSSCTLPGLQTLYRQRLAIGSLSGSDIFESYYIDTVFTCGTTMPNCQTATANLIQLNINRPSYSCIQCNTGSLPIINMAQTDVVLIRDPADTVNVYGLSAVSMYPGFSCTQMNSSISLLGNTISTGIIPNCIYYNNFGNNIVGCVNCAFGYNGVPVNLISRCSTYSSLLTCINCSQGFFLASPNLCSPVIAILNCSLYLTQVSFSVCSQCAPNFYLSTVQQCQPRVNTLGTTNCNNIVNQDDCTCPSLHVKDMTVLPFLCRQNPQYCTIASIVNGSVVCQNCDPTISFWNGQICFLGTVANCVQYEGAVVSSTLKINQCQICMNKFFLTNLNGITNCNPSTNLPNCITYSQTQINNCLTCSIDSLLFSVKIRCAQIPTLIAFCVTYSSPQQCSACANNYRVDNLGTRCLPIPPTENCISQNVIKLEKRFGFFNYTEADYYPTSSSNIFLYDCNLCNPGFIRDKNIIAFSPAISITTSLSISTGPNPNQCFSVLSHKRAQCTVNFTGTETITAASCPSCNTNFFPLAWTGMYLCLEKEYLSTFKQITITNCERLKYDLQLYKCEKCVFPFFLETDSTCVSACSSSSNIGLYINIKPMTTSFSFNNSNNICSTTGAIQGCAALTQKTLLSSADLGCARCLSGYIPLIAYTNTGSFPFDTLESSDQVVSPLTAYPIITCQSKSAVGIVIQGALNTTTGLVDNCKYYVLLSTSDNFGCIKCRYGFTGKIFKLGTTAPSGYINSCYSMSTCDPNSSELLSAGMSISNLETQNGVLSKYYSCYRCTQTGTIPFLFVNKAQTNGNIVDLLPYNFIAGNTAAMQVQYTPGSESEVLRCLPTTNTTSTGLQAFVTLSEFPGMPPNCALGIVNTAVTQSSDTQNVSPLSTPFVSAYCTSCLPNFVPTFMTVSLSIITACTAIVNCTGGTWMNACQNCVHYYDTILNKIDYTLCISAATVNSQNCYAARENSKCAICNIGFDMNSQGVCIQEIVPNCSIPNMSNNFYTQWGSTYPIAQGQTFWYLRPPINFGTQQIPGAPGCSACSNTANFILSQYSSEIDTNLQPAVCTTRFINPLNSLVANCSNYAWGNLSILDREVCVSCNTGFVLTFSSSSPLILPSCTANLNLQNCILANELNGTFCNTCATNFRNVGGVCFTNNLIPNCQTYSDSIYSTFALCSICNSGYVSSETNFSCVQITIPNCAELNTSTPPVCIRCMAGFVFYPTSNGFICYPTGIATQPLVSDPQCLTFDMSNSLNGFLTQSISCLTCSTGFFPVAVTDSSSYCYKFVQTTMIGCSAYSTIGSTKTFLCTACSPSQPTELTNTIQQMFFFNAPTSTCIQRTVIVNCVRYDPNSNSCVQCNINFSLAGNAQFCIPVYGISSSVGGVPNPAYYTTCIANNDCDNPIYQGLPSILNSIVSCHLCKDTTKIPIISAKYDVNNINVIGIQEFSFTPLVNNRFDIGSGEFSNKCLPPIATSYGIPPTQFNFPTNCAIALINSNSMADASNSNLSIGVDRQKIAVMCVACPPGFAPTRATDLQGIQINLMIAACTQILNCESSNWFNSCSQCSANFSYQYVEGQGVNYSQCISFPQNPNCFAVDVNNRCWFCQKGYQLNKDLFCELIQPPRCGYSTFRFNVPYQSKDIGTGFFASRDGIGCQQCDNGFTGLYANTAVTACTQSPYHFNKQVQQTSMYIFGCKNYLANNGDRMSCAICYPSFVLTRGGICVSNAKILNCSLAQNSSFCLKCLPKFINISRKCVPVGISNCLTYYFNSILNDQICQQCAPNFYLENNVCIAGTIQFCDIYSTRKICNQCQSGYALTIIAGITSYCFPIATDLNCSAVNLNQFGMGFINCTTCSDNTFILTRDQNDFYPVRCMSIIQTNFCVNYNFTRQLGGSEMNCIQCGNSTFLNTTQNTCMPRTYNSSQCAVYDLTSDSCVSCISGFFIDAVNKTLCNLKPNGIFACQNYTNATTCSQCQTGFFLNANNTCIVVPDGQLIAGCNLYKQNGLCVSCQTGFFQIGNQCHLANAQNCLTYNSINACASCLPNFGFSINGTIISCIQKNVQNCNLSGNVSPFPCIQCATGFYPLNGVCTQVTTILNGCNIYDNNNSTCQQCQHGYILVQNKTCVSTLGLPIDQNCAAYSTLASPICNSCQLGNYFSNGVCVPCAANGPQNGCSSCDPRNNSVCLACLTGWSQNVNKTCSKNPNTPSTNLTTNQTDQNNTNTSNNSQPTGNTTSKDLIRKILTMALIISLFIQINN